jgi:hypothetical protein
MIRKSVAALYFGAALAAALPAHAITDREKEQLARYERYAGTAVDDMPFWRLHRYESLGDEAVVVWTGVNTAWLIRVRPPCTELPWAKAIGLTSNTHRVSAKFDHVLAGRDRCMIASIQPIDYKQLRADQKAETAQKKAAAR